MTRDRLERLFSLGALVAASVLLAGCVQDPTTTPRVAKAHDAFSAQALLAVATRFNRDYAANRDGPVYDRWDRASQAIISRAAYLRYHKECPSPPGAAFIESANRTTHGFWQVHYSISGVQFIDYWHYVHGFWRFDLRRSNPSAVRLYELSFHAYAAAVGCTTHH